MVVFRRIVFSTLIILLMLAGIACAAIEIAPVTELTTLPSPTVTVAVAKEVPPTATPTPTVVPTETPIPPTASPTPKPNLEQVLLANARHIQGSDDAPVTFIEFSDFK